MTRQEIVQKLQRCASGFICTSIEHCGLLGKQGGCVECLTKEAADLIEAQAKELEQVKRERDAAVACIIGSVDNCDYCANKAENEKCEGADYSCYDCPEHCPCKECSNGSHFVWRGVEGGTEDG